MCPRMEVAITKTDFNARLKQASNFKLFLAKVNAINMKVIKKIKRIAKETLGVQCSYRNLV